MTLNEQDTIIEGILNIKKRIDNYTGRERHIFLIACRANIRLSKLIKSKRQFARLTEYEEYSKFVDEQLEKSASTRPTVMAPVWQMEP
jgi:hypothetical protein